MTVEGCLFNGSKFRSYQNKGKKSILNLEMHWRVNANNVRSVKKHCTLPKTIFQKECKNVNVYKVTISTTGINVD